MSPVQPMRSSRCGQSVGIDRKLPFMPHTTFSWNRLSRADDDSNQPVRTMSEPITSAVTDAGSNVPGQPSTDAYRNPWNVNCGAHSSSPLPLSTYVSVAFASRSGDEEWAPQFTF